jgi:hypothetical protein
MKNVMFDVQGTLLGYDGPCENVVKFFKFLQARGHAVSIWSFGGRGMAFDAASKCKLAPKLVMSKQQTLAPAAERTFDVCVDDDMSSARMLDAKQVIGVFDIPDDESEFEQFALKFSL